MTNIKYLLFVVVTYLGGQNVYLQKLLSVMYKPNAQYLSISKKDEQTKFLRNANSV